MPGLLLLYAVFTGSFVAAVFLAIDLLSKAGKKSGAADIGLGDIFAIGLVLTLGAVVAILSAITFRLAWFAWFVAAALAVFAAAYALRLRKGRADDRLMSGLVAEEEEQLLKVLGADRTNVAAWLRLAAVCEQKSDYPGAIRCLRKAAELEPGELSRSRLESLRARARETLRGQ